MNIDFYKKIVYNPPWMCCYVKLNNDKVEIAYGAFTEHRNKGIATEICRQLVSLAFKTDPEVIVTAIILPEENASADAIGKNSFVLLGLICGDEDGNV